MPFSNPIRLQTLFWEVKNRFFYVLFSFLVTVIIGYQKSNALLYLFVLSYTKKEANFCSSIAEKVALGKQEELATFLSNHIKNATPFAHPVRANDFWHQDTLSMISPFTARVTAGVGQGKENETTFDDIEKYAIFFSKGEQDCSLLFNNDFLSTLKESSLISFSKSINAIETSSIKFIFTDVEEAFSSQVLVCLIFSFLAILPHFTYNLFSFFIPSLYLYESKKWICRSFLFIIVWYSFNINVQNNIIPRFAEFLIQFQITSSAFNVVAETKIYSYCSWALSIFLLTNLIFISFYLIFFLIKSKKVSTDFLSVRRKWCRVVLLLFSALIAPPDLFVQFSLTLFLIFCLEVFIWFFSIYKHLLHCKWKSASLSPSIK